MDRKKFLLTTGLAAFSLSTFGNVSLTKSGFVSDCETSNDILGPFYRANAPERMDLTFSGLKGSVVELSGIVFGEDCITPLKNVLVEIWHCDTQGEYDNTSSKFLHRAVWRTNEKGEYAFKTILPGKYLNGKLFRPAHIHFRVSHPDHKALVSQIYFKGDPHIEMDPWASQKKAVQRILPISLKDTKGNLTVEFDVFLSVIK